MLDTETKARIDSARDILVGKVPDPKSQVEQITIALIYKFMDDMDRQSEELGGKPTFFTGEFKQYAWSRLIDKRLSGQERLNFYRDGIEKMNENKNIPQLFRDIFRGVFLPYRDPETLNLFLKEIDGFSYDHSERLGDAYEYLLNVLGTQGDAGQFRTPRHIIDFIVQVVDPQKQATVLDPACGTAGFLISAYKHILKNNENLTPDERSRLMTNFCGYDIAPDMGRLSRVNMYLHGFPNPVIHEYDALTSEERWDERYDIIVANPPFMSPKGGIRPHKRFSIQATRSEVLFVDYIAEHLTPNGRAGVIVPEGVVFQSQTTYRKLRRMLVETYLWAVVSLPGGVFNPYSGVKTSILFLDRVLARKLDKILFIKIANDGFDLGAQRRPIEGTQLPEALNLLGDRKQVLEPPNSGISLLVSRERLLENADCSLAGDRYRAMTALVSRNWPTVKIADIASILSGGTPSKANAEFWSGSVPWVSPKDMKVDRIQDTEDHVSQAAIQNSAVNLVPTGSILCVVRSGILAHSFPVALAGRDLTFNQDILAIVIKDVRVLREYLFHLLKGLEPYVVQSGVKKGGTVHSLQSRFLHDLAIPLPPKEEQERIVAELEGYSKVIEGARQVIGNYKPNFRIEAEWPLNTIGALCKSMQYGLSVPLKENGAGYRVFRMNEIVEGRLIDSGHMKRAELGGDEFEKYRLQKGDILFNRTNSFEHVGRTGIFLLDGDYTFASYLVRLSADTESINAMYLNVLMNTEWFQQSVKRLASRAIGQANISASSLAGFEIPVPPLDVQAQVVSSLEAERVLVKSNRKLIQIFEAKIKAKLDEIWGTSGEKTAEPEALSLEPEANDSLNDEQGVEIADAGTGR